VRKRPSIGFCSPTATSFAFAARVVCDLAAVTTVPAKGGAPEPIGRFRLEEDNELEGFRQPDVLQLCCRREGLNEVVAVETPPEAAVGTPLEATNRCSHTRPAIGDDPIE
jgi:hypothetical protein